MASTWWEAQMLGPLQTKTLTVSNAVKKFSDFGFTCDEEIVTRAFLGVRTAGVMITWTDEDPSTTSGILVPKDTTREIVGWPSISRLRFLREGNSDADVTLVLER